MCISYYEKIGEKVSCIQDEIPFGIPESWTWTRLDSVGNTSIGLTYKPTDISNKGIPVLRSCNIKNGVLVLDDIVKVNCEIPKNLMADTGDILICARNGSKALVGKCALITVPDMSFGAFMAKYKSICNPYIYHFINSDFFRKLFESEGISTQINQLTQAMIKSQLIPLPPLQEQERIVNTISKLYNRLERIIESIN